MSMRLGAAEEPGWMEGISDRTRILVARTAALAAVIVGLASAIAYLVLGRAEELYADWILHNVVLGSLGLGIFAWFAVVKQPRNGAVWALLWAAIFQTIKAASGAWTVLAAEAAGITRPVLDLTSGEMPLSVAIPVQLGAWTWIPGVFLVLTLVPLLFPDGRLLSARWRFVGWGAVASMAAVSAGFVWLARPNSGSDTLIRDQTLPGWLSALFIVLLAWVAASILALIIRYRRSEGEERNQFRWFVWGTGVFVVGMVFVVVSLGGEGDLSKALSLIPGSALIVALIVSITKYRLYEIDMVIGKTFTLAVLAVIIATVYVGIVVGLGSLFGSGENTQFGLQIAATAAVAIAFQPVRRRAQQWANRAVYGQRATPYEVLARFSHRAAETSDDELLARIPKLIVDGTGAVEATLWVRSDAGFRAAASWPESAVPTELSSSDTFEDPNADHSVPVFHDGELLGGISLVKARGEAIAPAEKELVENLASGMGLALRNDKLTSELRSQVAELEASRDRILAAVDEARRALEHDLDSGPQQQLVALKVMLGPTRKQATEAGASKSAQVLAQLETDAGEAIKAVREFSGGVYPPLLEAEGLVVAITQQTQKAAFPVAVEAGGLGRYLREIEAAVYFTILEALQNIAKYADASMVSVLLTQEDGELRFEVTDDGGGFDPLKVTAGSGLANMADRLDAIGGIWSLESEPGSGTTVSGKVPVADRVSV